MDKNENSKKQYNSSLDRQRAELDAFAKKLDAGLRDIFTSGKYERYLGFIARLHDYSWRNTLALAYQYPEGTYYAGYRTWEALGRHVKRGEKALAVIAPAPYTVQKPRYATDQDGNRILGHDGNPVIEYVPVTIPHYKVIHQTYALEQTEGRPVPSLGVNELAGDFDGAKKLTDALVMSSSVPVSFAGINRPGAKGIYNNRDHTITIRPDLSPTQTIKTLAHERAHSILHRESHKSRRPVAELEAESVAYIVCQHYGVDTSDYSFGYIAAWAGTKSLGYLRGSLDRIQAASREIIDSAGQYLGQSRNAALQKDNVESLSMSVSEDRSTGRRM